ncbi:unnamed protein product, partial [Staurois parvus]
MDTDRWHCWGYTDQGTLISALMISVRVRNGLASNSGTHLPCELQYQGWPADSALVWFSWAL